MLGLAFGNRRCVKRFRDDHHRHLARRDGPGGARRQRRRVARGARRRRHRAHRGGQPGAQRGDPRALRPRPRRGSSRRPARGPAPRRAVPGEGRGVPHRGRPVPLRHAVPAALGLDRARRHVARGTLSRLGTRVRRQDQHARARDQRHDRAARLRRDAQSVGSHAFARRVERRERGRGRVRDGRRRARQRHGRIDPVPRVDVRHRRPEAHPRTHDPRTEVRRVLGTAHARVRADAHGPRHRAPARRGRGSRPRRSVHRAATAPAVPRRGRRRPGPPAHRAAHAYAHGRRQRARLRRRGRTHRSPARVARSRRRAASTCPRSTSRSTPRSASS